MGFCERRHRLRPMYNTPDQCCCAKQVCQQACVNTNTPVKTYCSYNCAVTQHQCTATLFLAKAITTVQCCCSKQVASRCVTAHTPIKTYCSYSCAVTQHQCTATLFLAKSNLHCPVLLCKRGCQQACFSTNTPVKTYCSYNCAVTQHQCTATLFCDTLPGVSLWRR